MTRTSHPLELLAPAKDLEFGMEAIRHGADAVYIGGPTFGARAAAGNSVQDIAQLCQFAHRFGAHVYVAFNTLLKEEELAVAERLTHQLYEAGADALIVQDMGLLQLDLPPIALHASTQTDNRSVEKVRFLEQVGFSQVVLARELSLLQIREIADATDVALEFFIHGALCVSYSGQCYISHALTGRSANRGECAQICRLPCTLETQKEGKSLAHNSHLLSLKDMNQTHNLRQLIDAGVRSLKI
ncbi:MAG: peptidase U32 family protein, partial [Aeromonadaceae bacterium]